VSFNDVLLATFERTHRWYYRLIFALLLWLVFVLAWVYMRLDGLVLSCNQPLVFMIRALYVLILIQGLKQELVRCVLCYNLARDGPEPCRVRVFNWLLATVALCWPVVALAMVIQATHCDVAVVQCTELLIASYAVILIAVILLPALVVSLMFFLVTRGFVRLPRSPNAAPEGLLEQLEVVPFDARLFDDDNPEGHSASCSICLENFSADGQQIIVQTGCPSTARGHVFHKECLRGWLDMSKLCPLCRADLVLANDASAAASNAA